MTRLHVSWDPHEPEVWAIDRDYERQTILGPITVPQSFETDLASVPRTLWRKFPRWGRWSGAAVVHDFLYRTHPEGVNRWTADLVFYDIARSDGVTHGDAWQMFTAIRAFGDNAWNANRSAA